MASETPVVKSAVSGYPTSGPPADPFARQKHDEAMRKISRNDETKAAMLGIQYQIINRIRREL